MTDFSTLLAPMTVMASILFALGMALRAHDARHERRMRELRLARERLIVAYAAVDRFAADPDAPDALVDFLDDLKVALADDAAAQRLSDHVAAALGGADDGGTSAWDDLEALRRARPDLADVFETAIGSGLAALFLYQPHDEAVMTEAMTRLAADPSNGAAHVWRARTRLKTDDRDGPFGAGRPVPA